MTPRRIATAVVALLLIAYPFLPFIDAFWLSTAVFILIFAIAALGLNVLTGYTGQISLGHAFFLGAGAYTAGVLGLDHHVMAVFWILAAGVVAALCGLIIGPTALRLRGLYLAIVTIGVVFIGQHIFTNVPSISGGPPGRPFAVPMLCAGVTCQPGSTTFDFSQGFSFAGLTVDRNGSFYYAALVVLALAMLFVRNLLRTRAGRALQAVRERELAASVLGVELARWKVSAFVISSFLAGVSGALLASYLTFVQPGYWDLVLSIEFVAAIIVGGVGTLWGPLLGSIVIFGLQPVLQRYAASLPLLQQGSGGGISVSDASNVIYGVAIVLFLIFEPHGVVGLAQRIGRVVNGRRRVEPAAPAAAA